MFVKCLFALFAFAISAMVKLTLTYKMGKFQTPLSKCTLHSGGCLKSRTIVFHSSGPTNSSDKALFRLQNFAESASALLGVRGNTAFASRH